MNLLHNLTKENDVYKENLQKYTGQNMLNREERKKLKQAAKALKRTQRQAQKLENRMRLDKRPDVRMAAKIEHDKSKKSEMFNDTDVFQNDLDYTENLGVAKEAAKVVVSLSDRSLHDILLSKMIEFPIKSIVQLDLSYNNLTKIPGLSCLKNLEILDIKRNEFRNLPDDIAHLKLLTKLNASRNKLRPSADLLVLLTQPPLPSLQELDLSFNTKIFTQSILDLLSSLLPSVAINITVTFPPPPGAYVGKSPYERNPLLLRSQLEPFTTLQLRNRLVKTFGHPSYSNYGAAPEGRAHVMAKLLDEYARLGRQRKQVRSLGIPLSSDLLESVKRELEAWSDRYDKFQERPMIKASKYMILRSPTEAEHKLTKLGSRRAVSAIKKHERNITLWQAAKAVMSSVDEDFSRAFTGLAVTKGFIGSPHIDTTNIGPFWGLSVGDFDDGTGGICVEIDPFTVCEVNTKNRLGKIDGRFPHWVAPYDESKIRYSLIFYLTEGKVQPKTKAIFGEIFDF
jgi:hypothetical protein